MAKCDICDKEIDSPFQCNYCGGSFCGEHRLPPTHDCMNIEAWRSRSGPGLGNQGKKRSWLAGGEKPDITEGSSTSFTSSVWWTKKKIVLIIVIIVVILIILTQVVL